MSKDTLVDAVLMDVFGIPSQRIKIDQKILNELMEELKTPIYIDKKFIETETITLESYRNRRCAYDDCPYLSMRGIIYCEGHMYGFPSRIPEEILKKLDGEGQ